MDNVICNFCEKEFKRKRSQIKLAVKHYCSITCSEKGRRNGKNVLCSTCGLEVYKPLKALKGSKSGEYFCTKKCLLKWLTKVDHEHPNWKNGSFSYRQRLFREKRVESICVLCAENDSRMLAVHHIDKDRSNNSVKNLAWLCHNCHFLVHHYKKERDLFKKLHEAEV